MPEDGGEDGGTAQSTSSQSEATGAWFQESMGKGGGGAGRHQAGGLVIPLPIPRLLGAPWGPGLMGCTFLAVPFFQPPSHEAEGAGSHTHRGTSPNSQTSNPHPQPGCKDDLAAVRPGSHRLAVPSDPGRVTGIQRPQRLQSDAAGLNRCPLEPAAALIKWMFPLDRPGGTARAAHSSLAFSPRKAGVPPLKRLHPLPPHAKLLQVAGILMAGDG